MPSSTCIILALSAVIPGIEFATSQHHGCRMGLRSKDRQHLDVPHRSALPSHLDPRRRRLDARIDYRAQRRVIPRYVHSGLQRGQLHHHHLHR